MEDVELKNVTSDTPLTRNLNTKFGNYREERISTDQGSVLVAINGETVLPVIVTYHDLGLNYVSNFQAFFNYPDMAEILQKFCIVHINAPGQEDGAEPLSENYEYPSMDDLAVGVNNVLNALKIVKYIGIGVGLGGNVLLRHAREYPERVEALVIISTVCTTAGWIEWGYQKWNISYLRSHGITQSAVDYLMWHHFGQSQHDRPQDLINVFRRYFEQDVQPVNLAKLCEQYIWRTNVNIERDLPIDAESSEKEILLNSKSLQVPILNICGAHSPFVDETVVLNGKLNPKNSSWMKIRDCSLAIEEQPAKVTEAFRLFVQGLGYCLNIRKSSSIGLTQ